LALETNIDRPPTSAPRHLISEREAAELLGISYRTLQAWRVRGGGPLFCKIGRNVRYKVSDLDRWIEEQSRASTSNRAEAT